jgi:hypothetical protein
VVAVAGYADAVTVVLRRPEIRRAQRRENPVTGTLADIHRQMAPKVRGAQLRRAILAQDTWWVPKAGWEKFSHASLQITSAQRLRPAAVEIPDGTPIVTTRMVADFDALDETAGEKVRVAGMDGPYREFVIAFLWRQTGPMMRDLFWEHVCSPDPLGGDGGGNLDNAAWQASERALALSSDTPARRAWFDEQPLILALRGMTLADLEHARAVQQDPPAAQTVSDTDAEPAPYEGLVTAGSEPPSYEDLVTGTASSVTAVELTVPFAAQSGRASAALTDALEGCDLTSATYGYGGDIVVEPVSAYTLAQELLPALNAAGYAIVKIDRSA